MARPPSKGVFVRPRWEWELDGAISGWGNPGAVAGQFPFVALYNNSATGQVLKVYALFVVGTTATQVLALGWLGGIAGALQAANTGALSAGMPIGDGAIYQGNAVGAPPGAIFARFTGAGGLFQVVSDTPIARVPPGSSLVISNTTAGAALPAVTCWWVPEERSRAD